jgi:hypothetical protein
MYLREKKRKEGRKKKVGASSATLMVCAEICKRFRPLPPPRLTSSVLFFSLPPSHYARNPTLLSRSSTSHPLSSTTELVTVFCRLNHSVGVATGRWAVGRREPREVAALSHPGQRGRFTDSIFYVVCVINAESLNVTGSLVDLTKADVDGGPTSSDVGQRRAQRQRQWAKPRAGRWLESTDTCVTIATAETSISCCYAVDGSTSFVARTDGDLRWRRRHL